MRKRDRARRARQLVKDALHQLKLQEDATGLLHAMAACGLLRQDGEQAILQAGTCAWGPLRRGYDAAFELPWHQAPWHCWAAAPATGWIVDLTTELWPGRARRLKIDWLGPRPPEYVWKKITDDDWPEGVIYHPVQKANHSARLWAAEIERLLKRQVA